LAPRFIRYIRYIRYITRSSRPMTAALELSAALSVAFAAIWWLTNRPHNR